MLSLLFSLLASTNLWAADLPFQKYFGDYKVKSCKELSTQVSNKTFCELKKLSIREAPPENGFASTHLDLSPDVPYQHGRSDGSLHKSYESLSQWKGLKNVKYEENKEGSHYFDNVENQTTRLYLIRDVWIKSVEGGAINLKIRKRTSKSSDDKALIGEELNHELVLSR